MMPPLSRQAFEAFLSRGAFVFVRPPYNIVPCECCDPNCFGWRLVAELPMPSDHPWAVFLRARKDAIDWMHTEGGESFDTIARTLSMDPMQVELIALTRREELA